MLGFMMGIRLTKAFTPLTDQAIDLVGGNLGIFELADQNDAVLFIGYAGGKSLFGLRGVLQAYKPKTSATRFRIEINAAYLTRYQELLMTYLADFGQLPAENEAGDRENLGKLSPYSTEGGANGS